MVVFGKKIRSFTLDEFLSAAWLVYMLGILLVPRFKDLNNIYYLLVFPGALFLLGSRFIDLIKSELFIPLGLLSVWAFASVAWAENPDYGDLKSIVYVLCFIVFVSLVSEARVLSRWGWLVPIAILLQLSLSNFNVSVTDGRLSGYGVMTHPLYAGQYYLFFVWFFLHYKVLSSHAGLSTAARIAGLVLSVAGCVLTQSRTTAACIPLMFFLLIFLHGSLVVKKAIVAFFVLSGILIVGVVLANSWYMLPAKKVIYPVSMEAGDTLDIKFVIPEIAKSLALSMDGKPIIHYQETELFNKVGFLAKSSGVYEVSIGFTRNTVSPWRQVQLHLRKGSDRSANKLTLFKPPRILQFDPTFNHRSEIWAERLSQSLDKPVIGHGFSENKPVIFGNNYQVNDAHNFFLGIFFHLGFVGLALYSTMLIAGGVTLWRSREWSLLVLLICGIITTSFDDENFFSSSRPYWCLLLIPLGKALSLTLKNSKKENGQSSLIAGR